MIIGLENMIQKVQLNELLSLETREDLGRHHTLQIGNSELLWENKLFTMFTEVKPGSNGFKVHQESYRSDTRKIIDICVWE